MDISEILIHNREKIISQWVEKLHGEVSSTYSAESAKDLEPTISAAADANFTAIVHGDFSKVDAVIEWIGRIRFKGGFVLSEVQKAFELYRVILLPILARELGAAQIVTAMKTVNSCLSYTVHRFSDYFQGLHEQ